MKENNKISFIKMQIAIIIYSLVSVFSKLASIELSNYGRVTIKLLFTIGVMILFLGIYAIIWQSILKKSDLSLAYLNKGTVLFWTSIWSFIVFNEKISVKNILGVIIIFLGIILISRHE